MTQGTAACNVRDVMNDDERFAIWRKFLEGLVIGADGATSPLIDQMLELQAAPTGDQVQNYASQLRLETRATVDLLRLLGYGERADRMERAYRWGVWLTRALEEEGKRPSELAEQFDGETIRPSTVARWRTGEIVPSVERLVPIARFLNRNPLDVFRAAGYDAFAADVEQIVTETYEQVRASFAAESGAEPSAADLLKAIQSVGSQVGDLIAQVGEGLTQNAADIEAVAEVTYRHHQALGEARRDVEQVRADLDGTDRALRGHIDDPRAHEHPDSDY